MIFLDLNATILFFPGYIYSSEVQAEKMTVQKKFITFNISRISKKMFLTRYFV